MLVGPGEIGFHGGALGEFIKNAYNPNNELQWIMTYCIAEV